MALPRGEFTTLLRELRAAGPLGRVRLLARSLSALRGLSPWDRKVLLRMAGFQGAETLVERLAHEDEETAARLQGLVGELEERPDELERTVRDLADPGRRSEAVDELLATLDRGLGTGEEEPEEAPEGSEEPDEAPEAPDEEQAPESAPEPLPEPPPLPPPAPASRPETPPVPERPVPLATPAPSRSVGRASGPPAGDTATLREPTLPPEAPPRAPESPEAPGAPEPSEIPPEELLPAEPAPGEEAVRREKEPEPEPSPEPGPEPVATRPTAAPALPSVPADGGAPSAPGVLERLLELRRRAAGGEVPDAGSLAQTLEQEIPFPWARRRAVQAWIEGGGATDLDGALDLIATLPAATDRTWCLADLAERGEWSDGEWERIFEAAPTPAGRRRLERRRAIL